MHDKILHVIAKSIAENRDLLLSQISAIKSELQSKLDSLSVGVTAEFVQEHIKQDESVLKDDILKTVNIEVKNVVADINESVQVVQHTNIVNTQALSTEISELRLQIDALSKLADASEKANDDILSLIGKRFFEYDEAIEVLQQNQISSTAMLNLNKQHSDTVEGHLWGLVSTLKSVEDSQTELLSSTTKAHQDLLVSIAEQLCNVKNVGQWSPGIYREGRLVKCNFGDQFIALRDTSEQPSLDASDWSVVQMGLRFKGLFNVDTTYHEGDVVVKDGATWLNENGTLKLLAMRGEKGQRGEQGPIGKDGASGLSVIEVKAVVAEALIDTHALAVQCAKEATHMELKPFLETHIEKSVLRDIIQNAKSFEQFKSELLTII